MLFWVSALFWFLICCCVSLLIQEPSLGSGHHWVSRQAVVHRQLPFTLVHTATISRTSTICCVVSFPRMASQRFHSWTWAQRSTAYHKILIFIPTSHSCWTLWNSYLPRELVPPLWSRWPQVPLRLPAGLVCLLYALPSHDLARVVTRLRRIRQDRRRAVQSASHKVTLGWWLKGKCRRWRFQDTRDHRIKEPKPNVVLAFR